MQRPLSWSLECSYNNKASYVSDRILYCMLSTMTHTITVGSEFMNEIFNMSPWRAKISGFIFWVLIAVRPCCAEAFDRLARQVQHLLVQRHRFGIEIEVTTKYHEKKQNFHVERQTTVLQLFLEEADDNIIEVGFVKSTQKH